MMRIDLEEGHEFYYLDFPSASKTWEYDSQTGLWAELGDSAMMPTPESSRVSRLGFEPNAPPAA